MNRFDLAFLAASIPAAPVLGVRFVGDPRYRHRFTERLGWLAPIGQPEAPVWFHAASVGEVNAVHPLIQALGREGPGVPMVMTTLTMSGRERASRLEGIRRTQYAPFDLEACVEEAFRRWKPRLLAVVERELWPNLYLGAARHGVPLVVVNARMSSESLGWYTRAAHWFRPALAAVTLVLAQDAAAVERWRRLGVPADRVREAGNLKFDITPPAADPAAVRRDLGIPPETPLIVGGSTHAPEEEWLLDAAGERTLILAPRYPDRADEVQRLIERKGRRCRRLSRPGSGAGPSTGLGGAVILVDRMGALSRLYSAATVAFVGGSIAPRGGHNLLEPAVFGKPILTGPNLKNTREIAEALRQRGALKIVRTPEELKGALDGWLAAPEEARRCGEAARALALSGVGAVRRHVEELRKFVVSST